MPDLTLPAPLAHALGRRSAGERMAARAGMAIAGLGALALGGFAAYVVRERAQEQPRHDVLESDGAFSLRHYSGGLTAETRRIGARDTAMRSAFGTLAGYIFAKPGGRAAHADDRKIAMTVPVTAAPDAELGGTDEGGSGAGGAEWIVRFNLPSKWTKSNLPIPGPGVTIAERPARTVAVVQFAGNAKDENLVAQNRAKLLAWIERRGWTATSEPEFAGYNAPIIPGPLRRNELWIEVSGTPREADRAPYGSPGLRIDA